MMSKHSFEPFICQNGQDKNLDILFLFLVKLTSLIINNVITGKKYIQMNITKKCMAIYSQYINVCIQ